MPPKFSLFEFIEMRTIDSRPPMDASPQSVQVLVACLDDGSLPPVDMSHMDAAALPVLDEFRVTFPCSRGRILERARTIAIYMARCAHCQAALALGPRSPRELVDLMRDHSRVDPAHVTHAQAMLALRESARRQLLASQ